MQVFPPRQEGMVAAGNNEVFGPVTVRGCCTFQWREPEGGGPRTIDIRPAHCPACIVEVCRVTRPPERRVFEARLEEFRQSRSFKKPR